LGAEKKGESEDGREKTKGNGSWFWEKMGEGGVTF